MYLFIYAITLLRENQVIYCLWGGIGDKTERKGRSHTDQGGIDEGELASIQRGNAEAIQIGGGSAIIER